MQLLFNNSFITKSELPKFINCLNVYDALRVQDSIALFAEDHYERLLNSSNIAFHNYPIDFKQWEQKLYSLIEHANLINGNIRTDLFFEQKSYNEVIQIYQAKYPTTEDYTKGVKCKLQYDERKNPNAKIANSRVRNKAEQLKTQEHVYETLLVDHNNFITEGSSTNAFAICNNQLFSAPDNMILPGIMRSKILAVANKLKIEIILEPLSTSDISKVDALFLSGTSPRILPICQVNDTPIPIGHSIVNKIRAQLDHLALDYISSKKNKGNNINIF